jgi:RimJ/RimL family protein N-acetyltransferase
MLRGVERPTLSDGVVTLRASRPEDAEAIAAAVQDAEIKRWSLAIPYPYDRDDALVFIALSAEEAAAGRSHHFVAVDGDDRVIGSFGAMGDELGYWVAAPARGRGVATRGVILLRDWAHAALGYARIELQIHPANLASLRVAERAGFVDSGERRVPDRGQDPEPHAIYVWSAA